MKVRSSRRTRTSRVTQGTMFTFQRQTEVALLNQDEPTEPPAVVSTDNTYMSILGDDPTTNVIGNPAQCKNFGIAFAESLSKLQGFTEFTALFNYFRIKSITRRWVPVYGPGTTNSVGASGGSGTTSTFAYPTPTLMILNDRDSNEQVTAAMARENLAKRVLMNRPYTETWRPVPNMVVGQTQTGGSLFAVVPKSAPWLNIDEAAAVQHYGKRYGIIDWPGPNNSVGLEGDEPKCMWRIYSTYTVQFKGLR